MQLRRRLHLRLRGCVLQRFLDALLQVFGKFLFVPVATTCSVEVSVI